METKYKFERKDIFIVGFICVVAFSLGVVSRKDVKQTTINVGAGESVKTLPKIDVPKYDKPQNGNPNIGKSESTNWQNDTINKVVNLAYSYVGLREKGCNNCGADIEQFWLRFLPKDKGAKHPWCTYFTCFVLDSCGVPNPRTGWTPSLSSYKGVKIVYQIGKGHKVPKYEKYLVFTLYYTKLKRQGHSGIVVSVTDKTTTTIEGNTTMAGGRETYQGKDGVREMRRPTRDVYRFIKYAK